MYFRGEGVERDLARAHLWVTLAVEGGERKAARPRDMLADTLSAEDPEISRRRAER
jgi:TPR repeat protein